MKIGIIRESKTPPDSRVPLTPDQCRQAIEEFHIEIVVQKSPERCYSDDEYANAGIPLVDDISDCDVLMGVKEVKKELFLASKTYFFFSHTIKKQPYNRDMLLKILDQKIRLIDYEVLTDEKGKRLIAFGKFAGMVGAHNGVMAYGRKSGLFDLFRMKDCYDYAEAVKGYNAIDFPAIKVVVTGNGRVANGAVSVLEDMGFERVEPSVFLSASFESPVFTQLMPSDYVRRKNGQKFGLNHFYNNPKDYESRFDPYTKVADLMINGIYWDNNAPAFFSQEDMKTPAFKIKVIADVTCDIAPVSSIPSTLFASTIEHPVFGYDPENHEAVEPYQANFVDMMTIDNLPNELPRDASKAFGNMFLEHILKELLNPESEMIKRASITENGKLGFFFKYLEDYVAKG